MKKYLIALLCLSILVSALLACGNSADNTGSTSTGSASETKASSGQSSPAKHFKVGDSVQIGKIWQVVVSKVEVSPGSEFFKPKEGNVYLIANVTATNISNGEQILSSVINWTLKDKEGQKYNSTITDSNQSMLDGKVPAADKLKGNLAYEVPASQKAFTLAFEANAFASGQTIWDISI